MTEQQYRIIADRDKGDDVEAVQPETGDRLTYMYEVIDFGMNGVALVRIERPVPTTDEEDMERRRALHEQAHPSVPTREQIAKALADADGFPLAWRGFLSLADAVLALLNGADR